MYTMKWLVVCAVISLAALNAFAEPSIGSVAIHQALLDVGTDLRLMCVAAHPDDEDGASLAMYRKKYGYKTIALIATRGEGGQNEIGRELYEELGVIRTHEMARASAITGADLHFLDMPEFGYSKSAEEAFEVWGVEETLRRMVRKIRETRPDVIITHHGETGGHGHHQAVGRTLVKAFDAAADPEMFPEQIVEGLEPWQPARLYRRSFSGGSGYVTNRISELEPARGYTYAQIAAQALQEHESQGMGFFIDRFLTSRSRAQYVLVKEAPAGAQGSGTLPSPGGPLFDGLNDRVGSGARALSELRPSGEALAKAAIDLLKATTRDNTDAWDRANRLAATALGLRLTTKIKDAEVVPGQRLTLEAETMDFGVIDASTATYSIENAPWLPIETPAPKTKDFDSTGHANAGFTFTIPDGQPPTIPHPKYLFKPHFLEPQITVVAKVDAAGAVVELRSSILLDVAPLVTIEFSDAPYLVRRGVDRTLDFGLLLTNHQAGPGEVTVSLSAASGLTLSERTISVSFKAEGDQKAIPLQAKLDKNIRPGKYLISATIDGLGVKAEGETLVLDLSVPEDIRVGVFQSYDDTFMTTLDRLKVPHDALGVNDFTDARLDSFSTIIVDIRAYLVRPDLTANNQALLDYVHRGGTVIVMYHKTFEWKKEYAPYPLQLGRGRVTVEDAPINILEPEHPLFNVPNTISDADWDGWRQERGLYFPSRWDDKYTSLIYCTDPGEDLKPGSCLITQYGDGTYMYTALGWYRQLRELHPGTLRIFANMLAL